MSALQRVSGDVGCSDPRWWLRRQLELELLDQEPELWLWLGVAGQQQLPPVGRRQIIDHLDGGEFLERAARSVLVPTHGGDAAA